MIPAPIVADVILILFAVHNLYVRYVIITVINRHVGYLREVHYLH